MKTALDGLDRLDINLSSEADIKNASEYLLEGYRRMHALDQDNIIILKTRILEWRFYII